jgi:hypothetical protein
MTTQFKMAAKIWFTYTTYKPSLSSNFFICFIGCLNINLLCKNFFLKNSIWRFFASFSRKSGIRQKLQNAKTFAFSWRTNKKFCCPKINLKQPLNSRRPKLNFRMYQRRLSFLLRLLANLIMHFYRFWAGKKYKKYLEAPKLKMAAQLKMVAKIMTFW